MAGDRSNKVARRARVDVVARRSTPWSLIAAVVVVVLFAGGIFGYSVLQNNGKQDKAAALSAFTPSETDKDPSTTIPGIVIQPYAGANHVQPNQVVAYTHSPPFGGTHDSYWAACDGVVYTTPVRNENMVHALEHGSVWIAYNPKDITGAALQALAAKIKGRPYSMMSPYPDLDQPVSLQSWGHQLKLSDSNDPRIDEFIQALRSNPYQSPEPGASCQALGPGQFDQDNPPPYKPAPPVSAVNNTTVMPEVIQIAKTATEPVMPGQ